MSLEEIILEKEQRLEDIPNAFLSSVDKLQKDILKTILKYVGQLEKVGDKIKVSAKNFEISAAIVEELKKIVVGEDYVKAVTSFAKQFDTQAEMSDAYFKQEFKGFQTSELADAVLQNAKTNAVAALIDTTPKTKFIEPLKQLLDQQISTGAGWGEMVDNITTYAIGDKDVDGKLLQYSKQIAHDTFAVADRTYTNAVATELDIEFYQYFGGIIRDSREFCKVRHGKFYHYKEIEAWGELGDWAGKMPNTNSQTIFILAGGFNCRHSILPRSIFSVPRDVIKRNIANGNFKPTDKQKKALNL